MLRGCSGLRVSQLARELRQAWSPEGACHLVRTHRRMPSQPPVQRGGGARRERVERRLHHATVVKLW